MDSLSKYYRKLHKDLFRSFSSLIEKQDEKKVHKMRLIYKRIRVINKFISKELRGKDLFRHQSDKLDSIFAFSGMSREFHISVKLVKSCQRSFNQSYEQFAGFLEIRKKEVDTIVNDLIIETDFELIKKDAKKIYRYLEKFSEKKIYRKALRFIKRKIKRIESLVYICIENKRYHAIRTHIKDVFSFLKLFFTYNDFRKLNFNEERLKRIGVNLGRWHDLDILQKNLNDFFTLNHITDYHLPESKYRLLLDHIRIKQNKLLAQIDYKIIKTNLDISYFIGNESRNQIIQPVERSRENT
jgi:CHAD domain-containing protein